MRKNYYLFVSLLMVLFTACENEKVNIIEEYPAANDQWSVTLRGDNQSIRAYPDIFANYWEYTYSYAKNPYVGLRLTGKFPKARFFNFTIYNDDTQINVSSIEDVDITPDNGNINPYVIEADNYTTEGYTIHIIPASTSAAMRAGMNNICEFPDELATVSVFMRQYLPMQYSGDERGGTDMPAIEAFDVRTGERVNFPKHEASFIYNIPDIAVDEFSSASRALPFMRAPLNLFYPNAPAEYLFTRIQLNADSVAMFRFIPPVAPVSVSEYPTADVRYWSICLGASSTLSYVSIYDKEMQKCDAEGFVNFIVAAKDSPNLAALQEKAAANDGTYLLVWDCESWGKNILALYRNMVINENYNHSMRKQMESVSTDDMSQFNPLTMIAMLAMGNWGPQGYRFSESEYLNDSFNYALIRRMQ